MLLFLFFSFFIFSTHDKANTALYIVDMCLASLNTARCERRRRETFSLYFHLFQLFWDKIKWVFVLM